MSVADRHIHQYRPAHTSAHLICSGEGVCDAPRIDQADWIKENRCFEEQADGALCGQEKSIHEHITFDLEKDKDALARIREFLGDPYTTMSDADLLAKIKSDEGINTFRVTQWKSLPTPAFRRLR